jgi:hypothetical protein
MEARDLTAEDFSDWMTPRQALGILATHYGDFQLSKHALLERLREGIVQAVAGRCVLE